MKLTNVHYNVRHVRKKIAEAVPARPTNCLNRRVNLAPANRSRAVRCLETVSEIRKRDGPEEKWTPAGFMGCLFQPRRPRNGIILHDKTRRERGMKFSP